MRTFRQADSGSEGLIRGMTNRFVDHSKWEVGLTRNISNTEKRYKPAHNGIAG